MAVKQLKLSVIMGGEMRGDKMCWVSPRTCLERNLKDPAVHTLILQLKLVSPREKWIVIQSYNFLIDTSRKGGCLTKLTMFGSSHILLLTVILLDVSCPPLVLVYQILTSVNMLGERSHCEYSNILLRYYPSGYTVDLVF